jgi:hypothetical protein
MVSFELIKASSAKTLGRGLLQVKKYSPEILTAVGLVGLISAGVLASRATLKLEGVVDKVKVKKDEASAKLSDGSYTKDNYSKDISKAYVRGALDLTTLYGPAVTLGISSAACIIAAHGIMKKRNVALAAAFKAVETSFAEYKKRVAAAVGDEQEEHIRLGAEKTEVVDENGKKKKITKIDPNGISPYARFFDEYSENWNKTPEYNLLFVRSQQNYANDLLKARGHIFLNEVYDMLGIPRSQAGQVVGWAITENGEGDNFVDFGIYDFDKDGAHAFVNGLERSILLDFNVNGVIYDLI